MSKDDEIEIGINKIGPSGRPVATVFASPGVSLDNTTKLLQKHITRNEDIMKKIGLKSCLSCLSGLDLDIRHRFDEVIRARF